VTPGDIGLRVSAGATEDACMSQLLGVAEARAALDALPGLWWRPFAREELPEIAAFYEVCESFDGNPERTLLPELQEFFDSPRSVPAQDTLVGVEAGGAVVATAWAGCNRAVTEKRGVYLGGAVHPRRRGERIGRAVLRWELAHGSDWDHQSREPGHGPLVMRLLAPTAQTDVRDLAVRHGLSAERFFFEMSQRLSTPVQVPAVEGIRLCDWDSQRADEVHALLNSAFRGSWGHVDATPQMWQEQLASHTFRPAWSVLAVDGTTGDVVGVAVNVAYQQDWAPQGHTEGYTDRLAVRAGHRGRGIATGLLAASMRRFHGAGLDAAGLSVDSANPSGAARLYEALGYQQTASTCIHQLTRPAAD
jgi:mycothiol synthase